MIQVPDATTNHRALQGIRTAGVSDPYAHGGSYERARHHRSERRRREVAAPRTRSLYMLPIALNVVVGAIVALAEGHWEFAGHGDEGLGIAHRHRGGERCSRPSPSRRPL